MRQPSPPVVPPDAPEALEGSGTAKLGVLVTLALMAAGWGHTFSEMWLRWFPAWLNASSLHDRLTKGDSYYTHGPMVPAVSLVIAFLIHRHVGVPVRRTRGASAAGWGILGVSLAFHLLSVLARVMFVSGFAFVGVLLGLLLIWGGRPLLRAYWLPVAFLFFMVPLPAETIDGLNFQLKTIASGVAVWLTNNAFGVPANLDGSYVHLLPAADGSAKTLVVEDVCSGLRSMISLLCFSALFALICRAKGFWRVVMLVVAVPVAIVGNVMRITFLNLVAHYHGVDAAGPDSSLHELSGLMVFALALAMLFGLEQLILAAGKRLKRDWSDPRLLGFLDGLPRMPRARAATTTPAVLLILAASAGLSVYGAMRVVTLNRGEQARHAVPASININGVEMSGEDLTLDDRALQILETRDYVDRHFAGPGDPRGLNLLIVFSPDNRKGTHPPEICLKGAGETVVAKAYQPVPLARVGTVRYRELVTQRSSSLTYHLYLYKCGDSYTPSFFVQQARIFLFGLVRRNAGGALIHLSVPVRGTEVDAARQTGLAAAGVLTPAIDRGLP